MGDCIKSEITAEIWNFVMASEHIMTRDFSCHHSWRPDLIKTKILGASFVRGRITVILKDPLPERLTVSPRTFHESWFLGGGQLSISMISMSFMVDLFVWGVWFELLRSTSFAENCWKDKTSAGCPIVFFWLCQGYDQLPSLLFCHCSSLLRPWVCGWCHEKELPEEMTLCFFGRITGFGGKNAVLWCSDAPNILN